MGQSVFPAAGGGKSLKVAQFTSGLSTFTLPAGYGPSNPLTAEVLIVGGGGASGEGYFSSTSAQALGGGGGGGAVYRGTVQLTQNMNVGVGAGGCPNVNSGGPVTNFGGNGGTSFISTGLPKNMAINPQWLGVFSESVPSPLLGATGSQANSYPPKFGGAVGYFYTPYNSNTAQTQPYPVLPNTNYCWSTYAWSNAGAINVTMYMSWFDSNFAHISASKITSTQTVSGTSGAGMGRIEIGGTAPVNAAYTMIEIYRGSVNEIYFSNMQFESGTTTATTYKDGSVTGYMYAGPAAGAWTFATSDTTYYAAGGGGGDGKPNTNFPGGTTHSNGFAGGCSGGGIAWVNTALGTSGAISGHGGGAGGNAEFPIIVNGNATSGHVYVNGEQHKITRNYHATQGQGTRGIKYAIGASDTTIFNFGAPGIGDIEGYGAGGAGSIANTDATQYAEPIGSLSGPTDRELVRKLFGGKANTGQGGSHKRVYLSNSTVAGMSTPGGSGLVIIKYWE